MARFIAVHTMPMNEEQFMAMLKNLPAIPAGTTYKQTYCDFQDGKFFCEWEGTNKEIIEQGFKANNIPYDAVYPVRVFNIAKMSFED